MNEIAAPSAASDGAPRKLDDVMLAMDIVDTLRHREKIIDRELSAEDREARLIERLREIYAAQGIEVPDRILADGVKALEEKRFVYDPPKNTFSVKLAKFYIARDRWLKPFALIFGLAALVTGAYEFGVERPKAQAERRTQIELTQSLPRNLAEARDAALTNAVTDNARTQIETVYQNGLAAAQAEDADAARRAVTDLDAMAQLLRQDLTIRVVSRPNEMSGVFRVHDDDPGVRNYYLIVEAVDARGNAQTLEIASEEDQKRERVEKWGVRVPEAVFNRVAADKQDDQIIQNANIGAKPRGALSPAYEIETSGGAILEW
ncbi:MAG: hypothetical protein HKN14_14465 [Marinicaulis sp.]|nr:hypothetical protein [Marinicaulis sp.]NNE42111.1 hypothetical protein [Marinicaulis sp.]NNL87932.1 hypothetical protein [Marinicaulis sp.]